jgi:peptidoglycan/LPS O-acetylase OafA/YrhL
MISSNASYLRRVDHLRFYAAALVVVYHSFHTFNGVPIAPQNPLMSLIYEGHTGVSLFMVLSGFIFAVITFEKSISYWGFLYNRILRIYPLFLLAIIYAAYSHRGAVSFLDLIGIALPFGNLKGGVQGAIHGEFAALWTISVEFQFYLVFPFIKKFLQKGGAVWLWGFVLIFVLFRAMNFAITGTVQDLSYWTIIGKIDQFLIGMLAGLRYSKRPTEFSNPVFLPAAIALLLVCVQVFASAGGFYGNGIPSKKIWWIIWPTVEAGFWSIMILTYVQSRVSLGEIGENLIARLGTISFSIYVFHSVIIKALKTQFPTLAITGAPPTDALIFGFAVVLPTVILFASLSYRIVEKPFLEMRRPYTS